MRNLLILVLSIVFLNSLQSQIAYKYPTEKTLGVGSYGRIGVDWSFKNQGAIGRRLNLNNMGSIGGRLEEQDYLEMFTGFGFKPFSASDSTLVLAQIRFSVYSQSLSLLGNSTTTSIGGLAFALPEIFVEARNINNTGINVWVGSRLYRGPDLHIADHFYFNDHSGQGVGIEYKGTRLAGIYVGSTDTTATVPPYFYLNIGTGTPSIALRQRGVWVLEQDLEVNKNNTITFLGEYHRMSSAEEENIPDTLPDNLNYPGDLGFVGGIKHNLTIPGTYPAYNRLAIRYGSGIANGGDGGMSRTWLTFGAPDTSTLNFRGAYSLSVVEEFFYQFSQNYTFNAYLIYTQSKGGAATNGLSKTFFGREVYNRKEDFTVGFRQAYHFTEKFRLLSEVHLSRRKDGDNPWAQLIKLSFAPTLVPTGDQDFWARPELRFVTSIGFYNDYASEALYSPYLEFAGPDRVGYFFGITAEWWL